MAASLLFAAMTLSGAVAFVHFAPSGALSRPRAPLSRPADQRAIFKMVIAEPVREASPPARLNWPGSQGWQFWTWRGHNIHFVSQGEATTEKPAIVLIHGFGASAYHWRHQLPELSKRYRVYALDLLGFGLSDKPLEDYTPDIWRDQVVDFITEVVQGPAVVAGNSLGGYTALFSASEAPDRIKGCVLLNAAGSFDSEGGAAKAAAKAAAAAKASLLETFWENFQQSLQRAVLFASFSYTKQPARIAQVLRQVYSVNAANVDDELVESIRFPSDHPNAAEVFYRVVTRNAKGGGKTIDSLLSRLEVPLLLLWGEKDPWIRPATADAIMALHPPATRISLDAGHCPQDEAPAEVNAALLEWMAGIGY